MAFHCVLIADISGSTKLYEQVSQPEALARISLVLARMRAIVEDAGGTCVKSQGDDTLSHFASPDDAFGAARTMIQADRPDGLSLHAGLFFGEVLSQDNDIFGNAVNTAARLAALAKPGEILVGDEGYDRLSAENRSHLAPLGRIRLKGKREATRVYSLTVNPMSTQTVFLGAAGARTGRRTESATVSAGETHWTITEGESLSIGRSETCDIVLSDAWVSRHHGKLELRDAQLEFTDHSSAGSSALSADGHKLQVHRRATLLNGEGILLLGTADATAETSILRYATNDLIPD